MTGIEDRRVVITSGNLSMDGSDLKSLTPSSIEATSSGKSFWSSTARDANSGVEEVVEVSFGSPRMINLLSFHVSRFPCTVRVEYSGGEDQPWAPFKHSLGSNAPSSTAFQDAYLSIGESVPNVVNTAVTKNHPQHFGMKHWRREEWEVAPVKAERIRFRLKRINGNPPVDKAGNRVPYSLAMKQIKVGYRISSERDFPRGVPLDQPFEASKDILGSTVFYSIYKQKPDNAIDGSTDTYWRSEPQPVNYAVVPLYLDMRDEEGQAQVIDKFYVDPQTSGVAVSLYFSNDDPEGEFTGGAEPVPSSRRQENGRIVSEKGLLNFGDETHTGVSVSNLFLRTRAWEPWWIGIDAPLTQTPGVAHPIFAYGGNTLTKTDDTFTFTASSGETVDLVIPGHHTPPSDFRMALSYHPDDFNRDPYVRLSYYSPKHDEHESAEIVCDLGDERLIEGGSDLVIGQVDPGGVRQSLSLRSLIMKSETLDEATEAWFLDEGQGYVTDDQTYGVDRGANLNAILRMDSRFVTVDNIFGLVGGDGGRIENNVWRPINRDFILRKGFLEFPPVRAKYWKFEFTNLSPRVFEAFQTIERTMLAFPSSLVDSYTETGPQQTRRYEPHGVSVSASQSYSDALQSLRSSGGTTETTKVLVVKDLRAAEQAADTGWVWQYQPWHLGAPGVRWSQPGRHYYERIPVRHRTKVAFFVGIKELQPYRTDYTQADDIDEYVEKFQSDALISQSSGGTLEDDGFVAAVEGASLTSVLFNSYQNVRAVQFATIQTNPVQVLPDPDFLDSRGLWDYVGYGDVSPEKIDDGQVLIKRGYVPENYTNWEKVTYGDMEAYTYGELEGLVGSTPGDIAADGGIATAMSYSALGRGDLTGRAVVSTEGLVEGPVLLEIVDGANGVGTVVATTEKRLPASGLMELQVTYTPQSRVVQTEPAAGAETSYGELGRFLYGDMEAYTYGALEALEEENEEDPPLPETEIFSLRLRQQGGYTDEFFVHRMALYDDPIAWEFSNDDGASWYRASGVRNEPRGVMVFPEAHPQLRWRCEIAKEDASVSSITVRPWYGSRRTTAEPTHDLDRSGAVQSAWDNYPSLDQHPMWRAKIIPVEFEFKQPVEVEPFWRNLVLNPSSEGGYVDVTPSGGTVDSGVVTP